MKTKIVTLLVAFGYAILGFSQQGVNILPVEQWVPGTGSIGEFIKMGADTENSRVYMDGPHGNSVLAWQAESDDVNNSDGGFSVNFTIEPDKTYQYSVWMKNPNDNNLGRAQFRAKSNTLLKLDGTPVTTAYMYLGDIPNDNEWYLLVGYVHAHTTTNVENKGKIYKADGTGYISLTDFKFDPNTEDGQFIAGFRNSLVAGNLQYFWQPRVEEVNGNETTITDLVSTLPIDSYEKGNLLPSDSWEVGTGDQVPFYAYGNDLENSRLFESGPYEDNVMLWKTMSDGALDNSGGVNSTARVCDPNKTYRYMIWTKKHSDLECGISYFGALNGSNDQLIDISTGIGTPNPYFWSGDFPELDKWYLMVGYIHGKDYTGQGLQGGIYDIETGEKIPLKKEFKFLPTSKAMRLRVFLNKCTTSGAGQYYWNPYIEEVNESTKPISSYFLGKDVIWRTVGDEDAVYLRTGTVGIGLANDAVLDPAYKLMVDGVIKTREVKVNPQDWADFVFEPGYNLPTLNEVEKHILEKGYLPNIPSAKEVKKSGIYLGEMDAKLLQKIEELTLYQIAQQKRIETLEKELTLLKSRFE